MDGTSAFTLSVLERWRRRENLLPGLTLVALAAAGWAYVAYQAVAMGSMLSAMGGMAMGGLGGGVLFLFGWTAMMVAMMVLATLPLILLYRTIARKRLGPVQARVGMVALLAGYIAVWVSAGLPVYAYALFAEEAVRWPRCYRLCSWSLVAPTSSRRSSASATLAAAAR